GRRAAEVPEAPAPSPSLAVIVGEDPADTGARLRLARDLRAGQLPVRADLAPRKLSRQLESADKDGAHFAVIVGDELVAGNVVVRDLEAGRQRTVALADLARYLERSDARHRHGDLLDVRPVPLPPGARLPSDLIDEGRDE